MMRANPINGVPRASRPTYKPEYVAATPSARRMKIPLTVLQFVIVERVHKDGFTVRL